MAGAAPAGADAFVENKNIMKTLLRTILWVVILFSLALLADQIGPLKQISVYLGQHPRPYTTIAIALAVAGWALLGCSFFLGLWKRGRPMSEEGARQFMQSGREIRRFSGLAVGREFEVETTFREFKEAIRSGSGWRDAGWWIIFIGLIGLPLAMYGMFGYFIVIGAPLVKLICAGTLIYATFRTAWSFWKA